MARLARRACRKNVRTFAGLWRTGLVVLLQAVLPTLVEAEPIVSALPASVTFDTIAVGETATASVFIHNSGSTQASVTSIFPISGSVSLSASPESFVLAAGQSQVVTFTFAPAFAGDVSDAFKLISDAIVLDSTAPSLNIPVSGRATGPRMTISDARLSFQSQGVGTAVSNTLVIGNSGTQPLNVVAFLTTSNAFTVGATSFELAPNDKQSVVVTYTPTATSALSDTLTILSNSPNGSLLFVGLDAAETPTQSRSARILLLQTDGAASPAAGDSIRLALFLIPNADTIRGVEAFLGFDNTLLNPIGDEGPFLKSGLTESIDFQINTVEADGTTDAAAHFSTFFNQSQRAADTLAVIVFEVLEEIREETVIRLLTENPLRNSNFLSPENLSFAIPGSTRVEFGNRAPEIESFEIFSFDEDTELSIDLTERANDRETAGLDLTWRFEDPAGLFSVVVETTADTAKTARVTPPENGFGVFDILAIVTDGGGLSDTAAVVLDVGPTNDPPDVPVYSAPADSSDGLGSPVQLRWSGGDSEGDVVTYEVHLGTTPASLQAIAISLAEPQYDADGLGPNTTYFWRIVTVDASQARTEGLLSQFSTAPDLTPPQFLSVPKDTIVTSTGASILWDTDETSTSVVRFGLQQDLADSSDFEAAGSPVFLVLRHQVSLTDLSPETTYFYRVTSRDLFGNQSDSSIGSFTTLNSSFHFGDFDDNLIIDFTDFLAFAEAFNTNLGEPGYDQRADFNGSNTVDFEDFLEFAAIFGATLTKHITP